MRAKEMIPEFAEVTGIPAESVKVADRALADAGMRAKGRGPKPPEVTRQDVLRLLLGVVGSPALSRAHEYAAEASTAKIAYSHISRGGYDDLKYLIGLDEDKLKGMNLLDALTTICANLSKPEFEYMGYALGVGEVKLEIPVGGPVDLYVSNGLDAEAHYQFNVVTNYPGFPGVERLGRVRGSVLAWIGRTFNPEAEDE